MTFAQVLIALVARWWIALGTLILAVAVAAAVSLLIMTPKYQAEATVIVDYRGTEQISGAPSPGLLSPTYLQTQVEIIQSRRVGLRVVKNLKLGENPVGRAQFQEATGGRGNYDDWLAERLTQDVKVTPGKESSVITIQYRAAEPKFAAAMANAFAQAYIDINLELRTDPAKAVTQWFDGQLRDLRSQLETAQSKLSEYQQKTGIVATDERLDVESAKLAELSTQLTNLQAQRVDMEARRRQIDESIRLGLPMDDLPEVGGNQMIMGLRAELVRMEGRLKDASTLYGQNHPTYLRMVQEADAVRAKMREEMRSIAAGIGLSLRQSQQREAEARSAVAAQKAKVLELKKQRDDIAVLMRDIENAQRGYDAALSRRTVTEMEGQASQTNVSLLTPATEPITPSSPRIVLNLLVAAFLGTVLGVTLALLVEFIDARVRTERDVVEGLNLAFLGKVESRFGLWSRVRGLFRIPRFRARAA